MAADNFLNPDIFLSGRNFYFEPVGLSLIIFGHEILILKF